MPPQTKKINIRLVAQKAGVSIASVSRVVNNRTDVSEETRKRVQTVVDELDFVPNKGSDRIFNIGVLLAPGTAIFSNYLSSMLGGMIDFATRNGVHISVMSNVRGSERNTLQMIRERRCDALCVPMNGERLDELSCLKNSGLPVMLINTPVKGKRMGFINNNSYQGACLLTEHLLSLGHRKIGYLSQLIAAESDENHTMRYKGFCDTLQKYGITPERKYFVEHIPTAYTQESGYLQTEKLLRQAPEVTAIMAADDETALGAYKACWERGLKIPDDISVTGFDDLPLAGYFYPPLTTVRQPLYEMGAKAVNYLQLFLQNSLAELPGETLDFELVTRNSTKKI